MTKTATAPAPSDHKIAQPAALAAELRRLAASNLPLPADVAEHMIKTFGLEEQKDSE